MVCAKLRSMVTSRINLDGIGNQPAFRIAAKEFHAHLDACSWCDTHPFALCSIGRDLLQAVAEAGVNQ